LSDEEEGQPAEDGEAPGLVVVDPDAASRTRAEELEGALGLPIFAVDPSEFDAKECEEIQRAAAFVVCWDLGFRCGVDLLEELRANEAFKDRKILIAMDAPTRNLVRVAIELGADGVCHRAWDEEELRGGLARLGLAAAPDAA
jgi:DNA-binding NarL/FixJ family response regulator